MPDNLNHINDDSLSLDVSGIKNLEQKEKKGVAEPKPIVIPVEKKQVQMILNQNPDRQSIRHKINLKKSPKPQPPKEKLEIPPLAEIKTEKTPVLEMPTLDVPKIEEKNPTIQVNVLQIPEIQPIVEQEKPEKKPFDLDDFPSIVMKEEDLDLRLEVPKKEIKNPIKKKENKVGDKVGKQAVAWLILHTENQEPIYFDLFEGANVIGRGEPSRPADIEIQNDQYVSRFHAYIRIFQTPQKMFLYAIYDGMMTPPKPSLNGVYINGKKERIKINDAHYLKDSDTMQIGLTKLVFKSQEMTGSIEEACTQVLETEYTQTVLIR